MMTGEFLPGMPGSVCGTDSARLSVLSFCCTLLVQSRAQGVIHCALVELSLQ